MNLIYKFKKCSIQLYEVCIGKTKKVEKIDMVASLKGNK